MLEFLDGENSAIELENTSAVRYLMSRADLKGEVKQWNFHLQIQLMEVR
ncbi:hypothetical protein LACDD01_01282 [Lactococcus sp. DD01]|nr:hypothetical protein LACDD01_01282 [Lactococcus sp. DD01]